MNILKELADLSEQPVITDNTGKILVNSMTNEVFINTKAFLEGFLLEGRNYEPTAWEINLLGQGTCLLMFEFNNAEITLEIGDTKWYIIFSVDSINQKLIESYNFKPSEIIYLIKFLVHDYIHPAQ